MKKVWNQDETVKYLPSSITRWGIREPGQEEVVGKEIVTLSRYKINAWKVNAKGDECFFTIGYYDTKEEAVAEVERLDSLGDEAEAVEFEEKGIE